MPSSAMLSAPHSAATAEPWLLCAPTTWPLSQSAHSWNATRKLTGPPSMTWFMAALIRPAKTTATSAEWHSCWRVCLRRYREQQSTGSAVRAWTPSPSPRAQSNLQKLTWSLPAGLKACRELPLSCPNQSPPSAETRKFSIRPLVGASLIRSCKKCSARIPCPRQAKTLRNSLELAEGIRTALRTAASTAGPPHTNQGSLLGKPSRCKFPKRRVSRRSFVPTNILDPTPHLTLWQSCDLSSKPTEP